MLINESVVRKIIKRQLLLNENRNIDKAITDNPSNNSEKLLKIEIKNKRGRIKKVTKKYVQYDSKAIDAAIKEIFKQNFGNKITGILTATTSDGKPVVDIDKQKGKPRALNKKETKRLRKYIEFLIMNKGKINETEQDFINYNRKEKDKELDDAGKESKRNPDAEGGEAESDKDSSDSGGKSGETTKKKTPKKKTGGALVSIQKNLNEIKKKGFIDGDYQKKDLQVDGKWGARTRSAASKFLKLFEKEKIRTELGVKGEVKDLDKLVTTGPTKKPGSWKDVSLDIAKQIGIQGDENKYEVLDAILEKFLDTEGLTPDAEEGEGEGGDTGEVKKVFKSYAAARSLYKNKKHKFVSRNIIDFTKSTNESKLSFKSKSGKPTSLDPIKFTGDSAITAKFLCSSSKTKKEEYEFEYEFESSDLNNVNAGKFKIISVGGEFKADTNSPAFNKSMSVTEWERYSGRSPLVDKSGGGWFLNGKEVAAICSYGVRIALLNLGKAETKKAGGTETARAFLDMANPEDAKKRKSRQAKERKENEEIRAAQAVIKKGRSSN
jgi:hypothetical protein